MSLIPISKTDESERHVGDVECLLWHQQYVLSGGDDGKVKVWSPDLKLVTEFQAHDTPVYHMASEGENLYTCSSDTTIKEWAHGTWTLVRTLQGHQSPIRRLRIANDGRLYSGDEAGDVFIWKNGQLEGSFNVSGEIWDMFVDGNKIYNVNDRDVVIAEFNTKRGNCSVCSVMDGRGPLRVSGGTHLCFIDRTGMDLLVYDNQARGYPLLGRLKGHTMIINSIIGNPDCFFTAGWDAKVIAWNLNTLQKITEQPVDGYVNAMALSSVGNLYVAGADGQISSLKINF